MRVSPDYTIHQYREGMYKIVAFKGRRDPDVDFARAEPRHNEVKLSNNFSRARAMVLQYALCNPWEYFFTGTLDPAKYDRMQLGVFMVRLSQWIRDKRKAYDAKFQVLLVPERHKSGAWHVHGLIYGLPADVLQPFAPPAPWKLIAGGFLNWPDYQTAFGFCSLAPIRDPVATAYYIAKYIGKDLSQREGDVGQHLYFHSRPLRKAEPVSDIYAYNRQLEDLCTEDYQYVKVGMVEDAPWYFPYMWDGLDADPLPELYPQPLSDPLAGFDAGTLEPDFEQMNIAGWCNGRIPDSCSGARRFDSDLPHPAPE